MKNMINTVISVVFFVFISANCFAELMISEIMYNPPGADSKKEWIELYNTGTESVNLSGWKIIDSSVRNIEFYSGSEIIEPRSFAIIARNTSDFASDYAHYSGSIFTSTFTLSNSGAMIYLKNKNNDTIDFLGYTDLAEKGYTIEINDSNLDNGEMKNWRQGIYKGNPGVIQTNKGNIPGNETTDDGTGENQNTVPEFSFFSAVLAIVSVGAIYVFGRNK